ncbi:MAG: HDIG domain-containing metalloprotein [Chloroflexota bacterium]
MAKRQVSPRFQQLIQASRPWLFTVALIIGLTLIYSFNLVATDDLNVEVGLPVLEDITAPRSVTYPSEFLTAEKVDLETNAVADVYTVIDTQIGRNQLNLSRSIFSYIDVVRADSQASLETKITYINAIEDLNSEETVAESLINLNSSDYEVVRGEVLRIVNEIMREEIRETQVSEYRTRARRDAPLDLTATQTEVITDLAPQFIVPNIFFDETATEQARQQAADDVETVLREISEGQRILQAGDIVTDADVEDLIALGLLESETNWQDVASIIIIVVLSTVILMLYWFQYHRRHGQENGRYLGALFGILIVFALLSRVFQSGTGILVYWYPIAAMSMMLTVIFEERFAIIATLIMSLLYGFAAPNSLELMLYAMTGGIMASLTIHDAQRINALFRAGIIAAIGYITVIVIFRLTENMVDVVSLLQLALFAFANGILSAALSLVGFYLMGSVFGVTTTIQLQDLARLDHELLQELLRRAPGTYHHSIMVANLAEQAGEEIKANTGLIRVGAFYHDIGKMNRSPFFIENQEGINPHDSMDPYTSARILKSHVTDGLELARKHGLPDRIRSFIAQHHGTRMIKGFYFKAKEQAGDNEDEIDKSKFTYPGPLPQSPETAIVLMADAIESASRALQPDTPKAIEKLVNSLIDDDLADGQLDESGLTLGDIRKIRASFIKTLKGRFHVRVKYPGNDELMADQPAETPPAPEPIAETNGQPPQPRLDDTKPLGSNVPNSQ